MSDQGKANSLQAFATLEQLLTEDGWHPQRYGDGYVYRVGFAGRSGEFSCYADIEADTERFLFYIVAPIRAPEDRLGDVAEYIARANYDLEIGNFEMDFSDGEIRYKSSVGFKKTVLTPELIKNAIYPAVQTADRYLPGLIKVIYGETSPAEAIREIEGD